MTAFKYKIVEFKLGEKMEKTFNELGKEGWELVCVAPVDFFFFHGNVMTGLGVYGNGTKVGSFEKIAAYFKKTL